MKTALSEMLSQLRRETGRSQRRVSEELGISQGLLSHYETGAREPKLEFIVKVCDYYGVTADYIIGRARESCHVPVPRGFEQASRFFGLINEIFHILHECSDHELSSLAINYIELQAEAAAELLRDPDMPYSPKRDATMKLAESELLDKLKNR